MADQVTKKEDEVQVASEQPALLIEESKVESSDPLFDLMDD